MPSPEFERDKAMFELNVVQVALALANDKLSAINKDIKKYHDYVIDVLPKWVAQENKKLENAKERRIKEEARLERVLKYHEMVRMIKESEAKLEDIREEIRQKSKELTDQEELLRQTKTVLTRKNDM